MTRCENLAKEHVVAGTAAHTNAFCESR